MQRLLSLAVCLTLLAGLSCKKLEVPVAPDLTFEVSSPPDTILVYPWTSKEVWFSIVSGEVLEEEVVQDEHDFGDFIIWGPYYDIYYPARPLYLSVNAINVMDSARTVSIPMRAGQKTCVVSLTVDIREFDLVHTIMTNIPDDTIRVGRGSTFLFTFHFKDPLGNDVSRNRIQSATGSGNTVAEVMPFSAISKLVVEQFQSDSLLFEYLFAVLPDAVPTAEDSNLQVKFQFSNKSFYFPVRIIY